MFTPRVLPLFLLVLAFPVQGEGPKLGQPITEAELASWNINVLPDGRNLPRGSGTAAQGAPIFAQKCAMCHGEHGKGGISSALVGAPPMTSMSSPKTIANFWPYATTLFDFIRRAMPYQSPRSLSDGEVYALVAYLLAANKLIAEGEAMDAASLPKVRMPNRDGFIPRFPEKM